MDGSVNIPAPAYLSERGTLLDIGRVFASALHIGGIVVDLPEDFAHVGLIERSKVMLAIRVVVLAEIIEGSDLGDDTFLHLGR